jgi:transcriptional regulator with XRE-family HTH domain
MERMIRSWNRTKGVIVIEQPSPGRKAFGRSVRAYRERLNFTQAELCDRLNLSDSWLSNIETGQRLPTHPDVAKIEKSLEIPPGTLNEVRDQIAKESHPVGSFPVFTDAENAAVEIREYEAVAIPGLLQTAEYARALIAAGRPDDDPAVVDELVSTRMERQDILHRDRPPKLRFIVAEAVLRLPVGDSDVHATQLDVLIRAAETPGITVQVLPVSAGARAAVASSFTVFSFDERPEIAYSEDPVSGRLVEDKKLVRQYLSAFDIVRTSALPIDASLEMMKKVREEL